MPHFNLLYNWIVPFLSPVFLFLTFTLPGPVEQSGEQCGPSRGSFASSGTVLGLPAQPPHLGGRDGRGGHGD